MQLSPTMVLIKHEEICDSRLFLAATANPRRAIVLISLIEILHSDHPHSLVARGIIRAADTVLTHGEAPAAALL